MTKAFRTISDVLRSPLANYAKGGKAQATDRILRSTKLEDGIYADLRAGDETMDDLEVEAGKKLSSFPALSRDVYQSFYSLMPKRNEESELSVMAQKFNRGILDHVMRSEDYATIKGICEGRELPAYEAASEFITRTAGELDNLLADVGGDKGALNTLDKLQKAKNEAEDELAELLDRLHQSKGHNETLEKSVVTAANKTESLNRQAEAVGRLIDATASKHKDTVAAIVAGAAKAAVEKAEETQCILAAWGSSSGGMERSEVHTALLETVRKNENLKQIAKYLGRFREIFAQGKKNGYAYGRGEKYTLELGNNLSRALTSELAMLASPETIPLFLRKYQRKQIKQYRRREPIRKGAGDIICCLDESDSTRGDNAAWGKAVALTLLEIAADGGRSFALIHFSGAGGLVTDVFRPDEYTTADKMAAAERFLGGGTDFKPPMREAVSLMENGGFERADVVFITDGECMLPDDFVEQLREKQMELGFSVTGILLDAGSGMDFSLKEFCEKVYRTSELTGDEIVRDMAARRA
ncbi:MAG: hypothetical protein IJQ98_07465 [Oscillospiraceae bacterium]|nr:hypothetical protein [Oscillospiraceae bacterium]